MLLLLRHRPSQKYLSKTQRIYHALVTGIGDYFRKGRDLRKAILGLSGGIDSALVTVLATRALGPENVKVLLLPSEFSSAGSVGFTSIGERTSVYNIKLFPIAPLFKQYLETLKPHFDNLPFNVAENIQARIREYYWWLCQNKFGYIFCWTPLTKWSSCRIRNTCYGDMCGGLSVIGDVYQNEVYDICEFINTEKK